MGDPGSRKGQSPGCNDRGLIGGGWGQGEGGCAAAVHQAQEPWSCEGG